MIQIAKAAGARRVLAVGTSAGKEEICKAYGADAFINAKECDDLAATVREALGNPDGADVTLECAGNQASLLNCIHSIAKAS